MARRAEAIAEQRVPLSKERVLRTAMSLADQAGIESLTMRRLAEELGVEAMSLYYYVASKDDILDGLVDLVLSEIEAPTGKGHWKTALRTSAISFHDALGRHPWACSLMMSPRMVRRTRLLYMDAVLSRLRQAGFSPRMTHHAYHALDSHILGSTLWAAGYSSVGKEEAANFIQIVRRELPVDGHPYFYEHLAQHMTKSGPKDKSEFEFGLDLILDGLEKLRGRRPRRRPD
jgi:AcrR family transcriptional regulator